MRISITVEMDDNADETEVSNAVLTIACRAALVLAKQGTPNIDQEFYIDVADLSVVWSASVYRTQ